MSDKVKYTIKDAGRQVIGGLLDNNPVLVQLLGTCPTLATTTSVANAVGMGLAATAVLVFSNLFISLLRKLIPKEIRIAAYIVIISGFVSAVELLIKAYLPELDASLGVFIPLIVVNCIILARAEAFASRNPVIPSVVDGFAMGLGFTFALALISAVREIIGAGSFLGIPLFGENFRPALLIVMPSGAFLTLACIIAAVRKISSLAAERAHAAGKAGSDTADNADKNEIESIHAPEPVKPAEPAKASEPAKHTEPAKAAEPVKPVEPAKSAEPVRHTEPAKAAEPVKPAEPAKAAEPVKPAEPAKSAEPVKPAEPAKAADPVKHTEPVKSAEPIRHAEPAKAAEPVRQTEPAKSAEPVRHTEPAKSAEPVRHAEPAKAAEPDVKPDAAKPAGIDADKEKKPDPEKKPDAEKPAESDDDADDAEEIRSIDKKLAALDKILDSTKGEDR